MSPAPGPSTRELLATAAAGLEQAGVPSPAHDAAELLAHVLGTSRGRLVLVDSVAPDDLERYDELVGRRAAREPLQHLTGTAPFRHVELAVGPGVFVPRPETELLAGWAIEQALAVADRASRRAVVVDLCTGSGAIARSIVDEAPGADLHAVELDPAAYTWADRNLAGTGVDLRQGDMADAFADLDDTVDVVVCNPPYIPLTAWEGVAPEARDHDPELALWSGDDGLEAMRVLETVARRLLRPGGVVGAEHADVQGDAAPEVFRSREVWREVRDHRDLAGRPRFLTARLAR